MNSELIMKSDVLDIIFEKRNKSYGAYTLRKFYNNRLIKSMTIMLAAVIVFSAFTFLPESAKKETFIVMEPKFATAPLPEKKPEVKPKETKPPVKKVVAMIKLVNNIKIVNNKDSADILHNLDKMAIGSNTNIVPDGDVQIIAPAGGDFVETIKPVEPYVDINKPVDFAEVMPQYPGGMEALRKFLMKNLRNPRDMEEGELITVRVKFVVGFDGQLQRFELVEDGGTAFNNEVMRVLKKMPIWLPGKTKGQNVAVYYTIPVKFVGEG